MNQNKPLKTRTEAFCHHYIINDGNGTQAAISAGYSANGADVQAARLLGNARVMKRIDELRASVVRRANATEDEIFEFLTFAANFDPTVWVNVTSKGQMLLKCDLDQLPKMVKKMITEVKPTQFGVQVKWFSKEKALEMLARFHGMNKDKLEVTSDLTPAERQARIAELEAKRKTNVDTK